MNIAILVHSHTGHTLSVADKIREKLVSLGHTVHLQRISAKDENPNTRNPVVLLSRPNIEGCDAVIFGAPVWGFSLSAVMKECLSQLPRMDNRKAVCFVTHSFPFAFLGGNRSVQQLKQGCEHLGASVHTAAVIDWGSRRRDAQIGSLVEKTSKMS